MFRHWAERSGKACSIVLYLEAPGLFLFSLLNSVHIVRGRRGRRVYVHRLCERRGRSTRQDRGNRRPPVSTVIVCRLRSHRDKDCFLCGGLGKLGKMELLMWAQTALASRRDIW